MTLNDSMQGMDYVYGRTVYNRVIVRYNPRLEQDSSTYVLATYTSSIRIRRGETRAVNVRYDDGSGNRISTTSIIQPAASTDWTANTAADGSGSDITSDVAITATDYGQYAEWSIENTGPTDGYVINGSQSSDGPTQRGNNKLTDFGRAEVVVSTGSGDFPYTLNAALLSDESEVRDLANGILSQFSSARGEVASIRLKPRKNATLANAALGLQPGDRITLQETQTGYSDDVIVVGAAHDIPRSAKDWTGQIYVSPASITDTYWLIGVTGRSEIGQTTKVGY